MSFRQNVLSFVHRKGKYVKVAGKGLIKSHNGLSDRFKRMRIGSGAPAHKKDGEIGGSVKQHNRPYQLKDMEQPKKSTPSYKPIQFKL